MVEHLSKILASEEKYTTISDNCETDMMQETKQKKGPNKAGWTMTDPPVDTVSG